MLESQKFTLTDHHVKLARRMYVSWDDCEYGAPRIDCKRPYGSSSVAGDIHEILTGEEIGMVDSVREELTEEEEDKYRALHEEMETALQVILSAGTFDPGNYTADAYSAKWRKA